MSFLSNLFSSPKEPQMTRAELVAQLAALDAADAQAKADAAAQANVEALKSTVVSSVAGSGGIGARQDQFTLQRAQAYIPSEPTAQDALSILQVGLMLNS
jgi:hypothetical protein